MSHLSIILLSPVNKSSRLKQEIDMHRSSTIYKQKLSKTIKINFGFWCGLVDLVDFDVREQQGFGFSLEEVLWIIHYRLVFWPQDTTKLKRLNLFVTNTHIFASQDVNSWTGVVWINCGLLWCFYQLFGLTAPIHCRWSIGEQVI